MVIVHQYYQTYSELKRLKKVPDRRKGYTLTMQFYMTGLRSVCKIEDKGSIWNVTSNLTT